MGAEEGGVKVPPDEELSDVEGADVPVVASQSFEHFDHVCGLEADSVVTAGDKVEGDVVGAEGCALEVGADDLGDGDLVLHGLVAGAGEVGLLREMLLLGLVHELRLLDVNLIDADAIDAGTIDEVLVLDFLLQLPANLIVGGIGHARNDSRLLVLVSLIQPMSPLLLRLFLLGGLLLGGGSLAILGLGVMAGIFLLVHGEGPESGERLGVHEIVVIHGGRRDKEGLIVDRRRRRGKVKPEVGVQDGRCVGELDFGHSGG
mmetsp:Transcript_17157/g.43893  ORF Transcript_17157/g.43893 Transcript_17157/m.43893 type:complete len:260 (+) Transcript_17157:715-1494(+)